MPGLTAIRGLRGMYPREGPWVLTQRIWKGLFQPGSQAERLATLVPMERSPYSIYSVIRRYDIRRKQRKAAWDSLSHSFPWVTIPFTLTGYGVACFVCR